MADFEELERTRFDALGGIDNHDRAIDGSQRAVGVIGEVLVTRRIKQIERMQSLYSNVMTESTIRNTAIMLDIHPSRSVFWNTVLLGLDLTRELDRSAESQQLFGQCGFTGVRVCDDRKGTALGNGWSAEDMEAQLDEGTVGAFYQPQASQSMVDCEALCTLFLAFGA